MDVHDVADIFPLMTDEEYAALVADIRANGLLEPIWTYEGKIIDGRNRYRACQELGIEPHFREWTEQGALVDFVISLNLKRRHLTSSQKAVVALEIEKRLAKQNPLGRPTENGGNFSTISGKNRDLAAAKVGTNSHYVTDAKRIEIQAPELLADIRNGTLTIDAAKTLASLPEPKRQIALDKIACGEAKDARDAKRQLDRAEKVQTLLDKSRPLDGSLGQFPIIYADPPWQYDANTTDPSRQIEKEYPTMSLDDICALKVSEIAMSDCILYL